MTWKIIFALPLLAFSGCPSDEHKTPQKPPEDSKPYNILDYTQPVKKP